MAATQMLLDSSFTAPDELRDRLLGVSRDHLGGVAAALRPRPGGDAVITATKTAIRILGRRVLALDDELATIDAPLAPLVAGTAPSLLEVHGVGIDTAATLLVAAGDNPGRLRSEAAWAHLCGVAPIQASSGKVTRWRLNRDGDRQANSALWVVAITRMGSDPAPAPTSNGASKRAAPRPRSSASSSATSPARSSNTASRLITRSSRPGPIIG